MSLPLRRPPCRPLCRKWPEFDKVDDKVKRQSGRVLVLEEALASSILSTVTKIRPQRFFVIEAVKRLLPQRSPQVS